MGAEKVFQILIFMVPMLFSLSFHEAAHAWMAKRRGDATAAMLGRITLNPISHIDLFGTIIFPVISLFLGGPFFGWAKPVPVNTRNLKNIRRDQLLIALAGPVSNILLAAVFALVFHGLALFLGFKGGVPGADGVQIIAPLINLVYYAVILNLGLAFFNILPVPPLDGSYVLAGLLPRRYAIAYERLWQYGFVFLMLLLYIGAFKFLALPVNWIAKLLLGG